MCNESPNLHKHPHTSNFCSIIVNIRSIPNDMPTHGTSDLDDENIPTNLSYRPPAATEPTPTIVPPCSSSFVCSTFKVVSEQ